MPSKLHFLVTAGPTREKIDDVRDWGNIFTGRTGLDIALAFLDLGDVTLLTSNPDHADDYDGYYGRAGMLGVEKFRTYDDLRNLLTERMTGAGGAGGVGGGGGVDAVAMTAAVSDYSPAGVYRIVRKGGDAGAQAMKAEPGQEWWLVENVSAPKVKSNHGEIAVKGVPTPKLIDLFRTEWHFKGLLIKFKLEVGIDEQELIRVASASRLASGADLMVANTLAMARPPSGQAGAAYLIDAAGPVRIARSELGAKVAQWIKGKLPPPAARI
jgi:phosphopantothenoylcysteine synthetase/decarboxylase